MMTRTINDVEAIYESLAWGAVGLVTDALMILGTLGVMLALDWRLFLVSFALSPVIYVVVNVFRKRLRKLFFETMHLGISKRWDVSIFFWGEPLKPSFSGMHTEERKDTNLRKAAQKR